jgi:hypothetical protein
MHPSRHALTAPCIALLLVLAACGTRPPAGSTAAPNASDPDTPAVAGQGMSAANPAPVGTPVEAAKGWTVTVVETILQADRAMVGVNEFQHPQTGEQYVLANLKVHNGSDRPDPPLSAVKLSALSNGAANPAGHDLVPAPKLDLNAQLQPGATAQGWVPFQVPAGAHDVVLLAEPLITLDQNADQRFLALH